MKEPIKSHRHEHKLKARHKIINCPKCDGNKIVAVNYEYRYAKNVSQEWTVCCKQCGHTTDYYFSMDEAIYAWNTMDL